MPFPTCSCVWGVTRAMVSILRASILTIARILPRAVRDALTIAVAEIGAKRTACLQRRTAVI